MLKSTSETLKDTSEMPKNTSEMPKNTSTSEKSKGGISKTPKDTKDTHKGESNSVRSCSVDYCGNANNFQKQAQCKRCVKAGYQDCDLWKTENDKACIRCA